MKLGVQVGLGPGHIVLDRDPAPPSPKGHSPQFSAHIYCGQMAGWIMMSLGREVGLGVGDIVLDGDPAPLNKGHRPPLFGPCFLWPNGRMDQGVTWYECRPRPRPHCYMGIQLLPIRGTTPKFSAYVYCGHPYRDMLLYSYSHLFMQSRYYPGTTVVAFLRVGERY